MKSENYWLTTTRMPDDSTLNPIPSGVDVAVIGGGFTGLSAARTLAQHGVKVAVLETETMGWGASSRNGGMALTGLKVGMADILKRYGRDLARTLFQYSLDSVNTVEQIVQEEGIACGFERSGHLLAANTASHYEALNHEAELMAGEFNHKVRLVSASEMQNEIGSSLYHGALVDEISAGLNPAQFVSGLAAAAEKAGAVLCARARVNKLERGEKRFLVETERGTFHAAAVLAGTSGYTSSVTKELQKRILPIGSYIIATEKLPSALAQEISPRNRMIFDSRHFLNYYRLWDNRLIFGGRAAFFPENERTIRESGQILRREMIQVFPLLKNIQVEYVWGGTLDFAFDQMTHVGEMNGLFYSLGYAGHGVAMGTHTGKTLAEALIKGDIHKHPLAQFAFPKAPLGLYQGKPWFLPLAGLWYRVLDLLDV